jgi:hypothetical protein
MGTTPPSRKRVQRERRTSAVAIANEFVMIRISLSLWNSTSGKAVEPPSLLPAPPGPSRLSLVKAVRPERFLTLWRSGCGAKGGGSARGVPRRALLTPPGQAG